MGGGDAPLVVSAHELPSRYRSGGRQPRSSLSAPLVAAAGHCLGGVWGEGEDEDEGQPRDGG